MSRAGQDATLPITVFDPHRQRRARSRGRPGPPPQKPGPPPSRSADRVPTANTFGESLLSERAAVTSGSVPEVSSGYPLPIMCTPDYMLLARSQNGRSAKPLLVATTPRWPEHRPPAGKQERREHKDGDEERADGDHAVSRIQLGPAIDPSGLGNHERYHTRPQKQCHSSILRPAPCRGGVQTWWSAMRFIPANCMQPSRPPFKGSTGA